MRDIPSLPSPQLVTRRVVDRVAVAVLHNRPPRQLENTTHGGTLRASVVHDQNVMRKPSCIILP